MPDWDDFKTPKAKASGGAIFSFISIDELSKHAIQAWIIDGLQEMFGKGRVLTLIHSNPVAVYALLVVLWLAWVFYHAKQPKPQASESGRQEAKQNIENTKVGGDLRMVGEVGGNYIESLHIHDRVTLGARPRNILRLPAD